ncbi:Alcohol acetyltransferase [Knufia peltigerae]|uniref:Alcohol acetyltransferase n=1 Tax=Knufia peltigerae TaxID=1002370 RepID=A0AA38XY34_9EURO|nr:Alcohol acetyltransferase [Knufia peltigerae]
MWWSRSTPVHEYGDNYLRAASPNECRCIIREELDFYRTIVVGGLYEFEFSHPTKDSTSIVHTFAPAIKKCIDSHPHLSTIISGADTNSPYFESCPRLDLANHVEIRPQPRKTDQDEEEAIARLLPDILDMKPAQGIPPWKVIILPFDDCRVFVAFAYSHGPLDGMSGMIFHQTFLDSIQREPGDTGRDGNEKETLVYSPTFRQLPPPFDTKKNLPISWSFLLSPLLSVYLPPSFGFRANIITPTTWLGSSIFYDDPDKLKTGLEMFSVDSTTLKKVLEACRGTKIGGAKMTGLLHELISEAMFKLLPSTKYENLAAQTTINMRGAVGIPADEMGLCAGGDTEIIDRQSIGTGTRSWTVARSMTTKLAAVSQKTKDQSLGLLRYLNDVRSWTLSKIGEKRDCSYELSNLMSFRSNRNSSGVQIQKMVFAQPASVSGPTLFFNAVSVDGGPMTVTATWQIGALDLGTHQSQSQSGNESEFVKAICRRVQEGLVRIAEDE